MRNPKRIPIVLDIIKHIWKKYPDLRLGQLIWSMARGHPWHIEDYDLLEDGSKKFGFEINRETRKLPEYWVEPNTFKELIQTINREGVRGLSEKANKEVK